MSRLHFPEPLKHKHPPIRNADDVFQEQLTLGQRAADRVTGVLGSWGFIIIQSGILVVWVILNSVALALRWDPYPFILMNLFLSMQSAFAAPVIMMSQNRVNARDRVEAHNDYLINQKAEDEIRHVLEHLTAQDEALLSIHQMLAELQAGMNSKS